MKKVKLFAGVGEDEIFSMLSCLGARKACYKKGEYVLHQGEHLCDIMVPVEGSILIQKDDYWGNRSILGRFSVGDMFGEAYIAPESGAVLNDIIAERDCTLLFFNVNRIITTCPSACRFHALVIQNLFFAISERNRQLVQKLGHMSKRSTREKLISYLSEQAEKQNSPSFVIPFNRQQLADFLSVDRSAMSNELCKMRNEGLIEFDKSRFRLL